MIGEKAGWLISGACPVNGKGAIRRLYKISFHPNGTVDRVEIHLSIRADNQQKYGKSKPAE